MKNNALLYGFLAAITLLLCGIFVQNQILLHQMASASAKPATFKQTNFGENMRYGIVPLNDDGSIDVRIKSAERIGVSIEDINTYDNLEVTLDDINTNDELEVDIQEVGNSTVHSNGIPVKIRN
jgi:hypothetical protein